MNEYAKILLGAAGGAVLTLLLVAAFRGTTGYGMMGGGMMGGGLFGVLFALLLWVVLAAVLMAAVLYIVTTLRRR